MMVMSSYRAAIAQTSAAIISIAAPGDLYAHLVAPKIEVRQPKTFLDFSLGKDMFGQISLGWSVAEPSYVDISADQSAALFDALMASHTLVSGPILID